MEAGTAEAGLVATLLSPPELYLKFTDETLPFDSQGYQLLNVTRALLFDRFDKSLVDTSLPHRIKQRKKLLMLRGRGFFRRARREKILFPHYTSLPFFLKSKSLIPTVERYLSSTVKTVDETVVAVNDVHQPIPLHQKTETSQDILAEIDSLSCLQILGGNHISSFLKRLFD